MGRERRDLFQIGEVAGLFHISVGTLRHYEKLGLLCPEYTDSRTGYRYYSTRQFECLNTIRYLRALDMPLADIADFLRSRDTDKIRDMMVRQKEELKKKQEELRVIERKINNRLEQMEDALNSQLDTIKIRETPARRIAFLRAKLHLETHLDLEYSIRLLEQREENTVIFLGKVGVGILKERLLKGEFEEYDMVFAVLDEEDEFNGSTMTLPAETCAAIRFQGGHKQAPASYARLMEFIRSHCLVITGFSREITMVDHGLTGDTSKFVTEIQIPVEISHVLSGNIY